MMYVCNYNFEEGHISFSGDTVITYPGTECTHLALNIQSQAKSSFTHLPVYNQVKPLAKTLIDTQMKLVILMTKLSRSEAKR